MWINITKDVFEKSDLKSLFFLYQILSWYPDGSSIRYNILVDTTIVQSFSNFKKLSSIEKNLIEFLDIEYTRFVTETIPISYKIIQNKTPNKGSNVFNIEEAILFFNQPVSIVLENNKNDSEFIKAIITHLGKVEQENKAKDHLDNGWLQFENAGGCTNIPNFMEGFLDRFKKIASKNNRPVTDYFRGLIIIDSDKEFKAQPSKQSNLIQKLEALGINNSQIHILEKRMMENYLPKQVFQDIREQRAVQNDPDLKDWLEVYLTLTNEQLDYINIADGFPPQSNKYENNGSRKPVSSEILALFSLSSTDVNFKKLDKGFKFKGFEPNGDLKKGGSFKDEFPNLFKKPIINKQNLEARDGKGELQIISNKIKKLL